MISKTQRKNLVGNKKGISVMIGYVLLITFAVIMGVIVYQWIKTYVPRDALECSDGTSLFVKDYEYNCSINELTLILVNNGRFNIGGYFIHATNSSDQVLATKDISEFIMGERIGNAVKFSGADNSFKPGDSSQEHVFDLSTSNLGQVYSVEIIPVRWQVEDSNKKIVSCGKSKVKEIISCS